MVHHSILFLSLMVFFPLNLLFLPPVAHFFPPNLLPKTFTDKNLKDLIFLRINSYPDTYCSGSQGSLRIDDYFEIDYEACKQKCLYQRQDCTFFSHGVWLKAGLHYNSERCQLYKTCKPSKQQGTTLTSIRKDKILKMLFIGHFFLLFLSFSLRIENRLVFLLFTGVMCWIIQLTWFSLDDKNEEFIAAIFAHQICTASLFVSQAISPKVKKVETLTAKVIAQEKKDQ